MPDAFNCNDELINFIKNVKNNLNPYIDKFDELKNSLLELDENKIKKLSDELNVDGDRVKKIIKFLSKYNSLEDAIVGILFDENINIDNDDLLLLENLFKTDFDSLFKPDPMLMDVGKPVELSPIDKKIAELDEHIDNVWQNLLGVSSKLWTIIENKDCLETLQSLLEMRKNLSDLDKDNLQKNLKKIIQLSLRVDQDIFREIKDKSPQELKDFIRSLDEDKLDKIKTLLSELKNIDNIQFIPDNFNCDETVLNFMKKIDKGVLIKYQELKEKVGDSPEKYKKIAQAIGADENQIKKIKNLLSANSLENIIVKILFNQETDPEILEKLEKLLYLDYDSLFSEDESVAEPEPSVEPEPVAEPESVVEPQQLIIEPGKEPKNFIIENPGKKPKNFIIENPGKKPQQPIKNNDDKPKNFIIENPGEEPKKFIIENPGKKPKNFIIENPGKKPQQPIKNNDDKREINLFKTLSDYLSMALTGVGVPDLITNIPEKEKIDENQDDDLYEDIAAGISSGQIRGDESDIVKLVKRDMTGSSKADFDEKCDPAMKYLMAADTLNFNFNNQSKDETIADIVGVLGSSLSNLFSQGRSDTNKTNSLVLSELPGDLLANLGNTTNVKKIEENLYKLTKKNPDAGLTIIKNFIIRINHIYYPDFKKYRDLVTLCKKWHAKHPDKNLYPTGVFENPSREIDLL